MKKFGQLRPFLDIQTEFNPARQDPVIAHVTGDSRAARPGSLFVAIGGDSFDGHHFISDAVERGAVAIVGTATLDELADCGVSLSDAVPYCHVKNSRNALAWASAALFDFPSRSMTIIGITGTDGKTSTATLLESILATASRDHASPAGRVGVISTVGARICGQERETGLHVTTPDAPIVQRYLADMRQAGCEYAIVESTSHGLAQGRVTAVDFDVAAVTNITHEHLDYHGSWQDYAAAKGALFRALFYSHEGDGTPPVALLNYDDRASFELLGSVLAEASRTSERDIRTCTYGLAVGEARPDMSASHIHYRPDCTTFDTTWRGKTFPIETKLIGEFNVYNILCAATIALELGIPIDAVQRGVASLDGIVGRMERIDGGQSFLAMVDFAHSPASLARALKTLRTVVGPEGRIIAVFGSAGLRDKEKRKLMGDVSGKLADFTVITAEDPRTEDLDSINCAIEAGILEHADAKAYTIVPDRMEAIRYAVNLARPGDVVAAFGKGHERSMCIGEIEYPWSDQDAMIRALADRNKQATDG